jgi:hypothetical protein
MKATTTVKYINLIVFCVCFHATITRDTSNCAAKFNEAGIAGSISQPYLPAQAKNALQLEASFENGQEPDTSKKVRRVFMLLTSSPKWFETDSDDEFTRRVIIEYLEQIAVFDINIIRQAVEMHVNYMKEDKEYVYRMSRIFVLNRYIFNIPANTKLTHPNGGWILPENSNSQMDMLWPLSESKDGKLQLTGTAIFYVGPVFDALKEFDSFHKIYGIRKKK